MYHLTQLGLQLNEHEEKIAPTDSRNRSDIRRMEDALWDQASSNNKRIEEKQRNLEKSGIKNKPMWFESTTDSLTNETLFVTNGKYWNCKEKHDWTECPDLF
jgi:hypothetical protein